MDATGEARKDRKIFREGGCRDYAVTWVEKKNDMESNKGEEAVKKETKAHHYYDAGAWYPVGFFSGCGKNSK